MFRYLVIFTLLFSELSFAQKVKEFELFKKKTEDFPQFKYGKTEYDSLIFWNKQMTIEALNGFFSAKVKLSFIVDSLGLVDSIRVSDYTIEKIEGYITKEYSLDQMKKINSDLKNEAVRLIQMTSGLWNPAKNGGRSVQTKMFTYIYFSALAERNYPKSSSSNESSGNTMKMYLVKPNEGYKQSQLYGLYERKVKENKMDLAMVYLKQALRYFENKIQNTPSDIDAYYNKGICHVKLNQYADACKSFGTCKLLGDGSVQKLIDIYCK